MSTEYEYVLNSFASALIEVETTKHPPASIRNSNFVKLLSITVPTHGNQYHEDASHCFRSCPAP